MTTPNSIFTGLTGDILDAFESTCKPLITADQRSSKADDGNLAAEASKTSATGEVEANDTNIEDTEGKSAEQAKINFSSLICDFPNNWESRLHIHMTKKHANIEQVDGNETLIDDDWEEDTKYTETSHY